MRTKNEHNRALEGSVYWEMRLLQELERTPMTTQRSLAKRTGTALSMANLLLRRLAQKGYVRMTRAGWRSWLYTLTPSGFSRKLQLTLAYIHRFLDHYQEVRQQLRQVLEPLGLHTESRVALYGTGELAELVYLGLRELGIEQIEIFASEEGGNFLGMPVQGVSSLRPELYDRVVIASLKVDTSLKTLQQVGIPLERVVTLFPLDKEHPSS